MVQVEVRLRATNTAPSFLMPFTNPELDVDVSAQMSSHAAVEMGLTQVLHLHYLRHATSATLPATRAAALDAVGHKFDWQHEAGARAESRQV